MLSSHHTSPCSMSTRHAPKEHHGKPSGVKTTSSSSMTASTSTPTNRSSTESSHSGTGHHARNQPKAEGPNSRVPSKPEQKSSSSSSKGRPSSSNHGQTSHHPHSSSSAHHSSSSQRSNHSSHQLHDRANHSQHHPVSFTAALALSPCFYIVFSPWDCPSFSGTRQVQYWVNENKCV